MSFFACTFLWSFIQFLENYGMATLIQFLKITVIGGCRLWNFYKIRIYIFPGCRNILSVTSTGLAIVCLWFSDSVFRYIVLSRSPKIPYILRYLIFWSICLVQTSQYVQCFLDTSCSFLKFAVFFNFSIKYAKRLRSLLKVIQQEKMTLQYALLKCPQRCNWYIWFTLLFDAVICIQEW